MQKDSLKKLGALGPLLLVPTLTENEIVKSIKEMSTKFTSRRDQITDYVLDEKHVSAYASFYLPTNIPQLHFLLEKLDESVLADLSARPFIDVGCGPGTFSLGWSLLFNSPPKEVIAIDSSLLMLKQAEKILRGFFPDINLKTEKKFNGKKSDSVLFFGHSINEMGTNRAEDLVATVDPEYVVFIEPGTSELFTELKKLRANLLEHYDVLYPCPSSAACPSDWCHQVLRTSHSPEIERLSQLVSLDRKILPMTAHVYRRKQNLAVQDPTVIRYINETKFSFEYEVCFFHEGENKNAIVEIQKKHLSKEQEKHFKNANVGDKIKFEIEKQVGSKFRVRLL